MKALSMDLGGSHAALAIVEDRSIQVSREIAVDSSAGLLPVLPALVTMFREMLAEASLQARDCIGLAVSIAAMTQHDAVVSTNGKYEDAPGIDLRGWCREQLGIPFALENDARMALLGEWYAGAARGAEDVVMMTLGTGIGAAAMAGGKVYRTKAVQGGCLGGHIPARFMGRRCTCGGRGCMEAEACGWALPAIVREWPGFQTSRMAEASAINFRTLFELADAGDTVAVEVRERCLQVWASGTVGLIHAYGPELVVIGGGVMRSAHLILPYIQDYVDHNSWRPSGDVPIVAAKLGNHAGLLGAIPLLTGIAR